MRKTLGLMGLGLGAAPGIWWGLKGMASDPTNPAVTLGDRGAGWNSSYPFAKSGSAGLTDPSVFNRAIPVDAFNRAVWNDVNGIASPFGSKSPWGDNSAATGTPPPVAAAVSGLLSGAKAATGNDRVSPWDVAATAAKGGVAGLVGGLVLGKTLGALAGLRPDSQQALQNAGLWGGLLTSVVGKVF